MEVTVLGSGYIGLTQPARLAEECRQMCGKDVDANHVADGKIVIAFSGLIRVEDINGAPDLSNYIVGKGVEGRGV